MARCTGFSLAAPDHVISKAAVTLPGQHEGAVAAGKHEV